MTAPKKVLFSTARSFLPSIACIVLMTLLPSLSDNALAALQKKGTASIEETWNPHPDKGDVCLPMPGGLSMAFRVVAVPADGFLWDLPLLPGRNGTDERAFYDRRYTAGLSAPFSEQDVPASWKADLPDGRHFFYLIAKYEVSRMQWRAVMEEGFDPASVNADDARPVTDISWFDAVAFTERYTCWLLENRPQALPSFVGDTRNTGFVRLPTEVEWEYAARGGQTVSMQSLTLDDFFPMKENERLADYAVYQEKGSSHAADNLAKIGSRLPNPLGLYDTAGNAAEMTMDSFRFSMGRKLLGSAGGFVRKGGSFLSGEEEILPGRREETAFFLKDGPQKPRDLGFRPVVSGINTPGGGRLDALQSEYRKAGERTRRASDAVAETTPMAELDRLIEDTDNGGIKENLLKLRETLKEANVIREKEQLTTATSSIQYCLTMLESIRNYNYRQLVLKTRFDDCREELSKAKGERKKFLQKILATVDKGTKDTKDAIIRTCEIYTSALDDIVAADPDINRKALARLAKDHAASDFFNKRMSTNLGVFKKHYASRCKGSKLTSKTILADLKESQKKK